LPTKYLKLAELCEKLETISEKIPKVKLVANFLKELEENEIAPATRLIIGRIIPPWGTDTLDVSWATIIKVVKDITKASDKELFDAFNKFGDPGDMVKLLYETKKVVKQATLVEFDLTIEEVDRIIKSIASIKGEGSRDKKERLLYTLLSRSSPVEAKFLVRAFLGEMRHGVNEGLMEEAISQASKIPLDLIKRAHMLIGDLGEVAYIAIVEGIDKLKSVKMKLFHPILPMLAQQAENVYEAIREHGGKTAFEFKLDGARVQIHVSYGNVRIFSRRLTDVTESLPDLVTIISDKFKDREVILEGEVIAVDKNGKPLPFQHLMRRFRRVKDIQKVMKEIPAKLYLFDILYLDGKLLIDEPYVKRWEILKQVCNGLNLVDRLITSDGREAEKFFKQSRELGHEGLMAKKLDSKYTPGSRGKLWLKIKETMETLDLVIVAAEWGHGRRKNWLSDYYLAARDEKTGEFKIIGKTFKGLTDEEMREMTAKLLSLKIRERGRIVYVRPEVVVEVQYDEIQKSPKYESGLALRFARISKIRTDKGPSEADTIQKVMKLYNEQFQRKGKI